jgi:hypothetical protein
MSAIIEVNKSLAREKLDAELKKMKSKKAPIDLIKYFGKVDFGGDGFE